MLPYHIIITIVAALVFVGNAQSIDSLNSSTKPPPKLNGVATWWGQTGGELEDVCKDSSYTIVIIAFLNTFFGSASMPGMNLAGAVSSPSQAQKDAGATDLLDCAPLVPAVQECQSRGKKVFISLGGQAANQNLTDDNQGMLLADMIWNLFLGGQAKNMTLLRPFGNLVFDGVDLDIETQNRTGWIGFVEQMRRRIAEDKDREYYISAAPQCMRQHFAGNGSSLAVGDLSISDEVLQKTDITWVQFYNNPGCNHGDAGFYSAVAEWAEAVYPSQLWIAGPGGPTKMSATNGYADIVTMKREVLATKAMDLPNLGGWALWDAVTAMNNSNYQQSVSNALKGSGHQFESLGPLLIVPALCLLLGTLGAGYWAGKRHAASLQAQKRYSKILGARRCAVCGRHFSTETGYILHRLFVYRCRSSIAVHNIEDRPDHSDEMLHTLRQFESNSHLSLTSTMLETDYGEPFLDSMASFVFPLKPQQTASTPREVRTLSSQRFYAKQGPLGSKTSIHPQIPSSTW